MSSSSVSLPLSHLKKEERNGVRCFAGGVPLTGDKRVWFHVIDCKTHGQKKMVLYLPDSTYIPTEETREIFDKIYSFAAYVVAGGGWRPGLGGHRRGRDTLRVSIPISGAARVCTRHYSSRRGKEGRRISLLRSRCSVDHLENEQQQQEKMIDLLLLLLLLLLQNKDIKDCVRFFLSSFLTQLSHCQHHAHKMATVPEAIFDGFIQNLRNLGVHSAENEKSIRYANCIRLAEYIFDFGMNGVTFSKTQGDQAGPLLFHCLARLAEYAEAESQAPDLKFGDGKAREACTARSMIAFLVDPNSPYRGMRAWTTIMPPLAAIQMAVNGGAGGRSVYRPDGPGKATVFSGMPEGGLLHLLIDWSFSKVDFGKWDARFSNYKPPNYGNADQYAKAPTPQSFHPQSHFWWRVVNKAMKYAQDPKLEAMTAAAAAAGFHVVTW